MSLNIYITVEDKISLKNIATNANKSVGELIKSEIIDKPVRIEISNFNLTHMWISDIRFRSVDHFMDVINRLVGEKCKLDPDTMIVSTKGKYSRPIGKLIVG